MNTRTEVDGAADASASVEVARRYAQHVAPTFVTLARRAVELAAIEPGQTVLDAGTGTGLAAFLAAERAGREGAVIGVDSSPAMLDVARERAASVGYQHIRWQQGDVQHLTFADESFDAALCVQTLMLVPRPDAALEELRRVLVEGGRAVLTLWGPKANNQWMGILEVALRQAAPGLAPPPPFGLWQPGNLEALLQAVGFEQIEVARAPDRMRFQGVDAFWDWACATQRWGRTIAGLARERREAMRSVIVSSLTPALRQGELALGREIVYARAIAPAAP